MMVVMIWGLAVMFFVLIVFLVIFVAKDVVEFEFDVQPPWKFCIKFKRTSS